MELHPRQTIGDGHARTGEETRADAVGDVAEAEVEAGGLDLIGVGAHGNDDLPALEELADGLARKNARRGLHGAKR